MKRIQHTVSLVVLSALIVLCAGVFSPIFAQSLNERLIHFKHPRPSIDSQNIYLLVKPDLRKCISPICGGWVVTAVNQHLLKCPDGAVRKECYVGTDKINIPNISADQINELRQAMSVSNVLISGVITKRIDYGLLVINAAWLSATDQKPSGKFVSVSDNGIRCITFPCPSFDAKILNRRAVKTLAGYDLIRVDADKTQLARAELAVQTDEGLHMAGRFVEITGPAGISQGIEASQFYLKLKGLEPKMCAPTGCSGQICADTNISTTCEWKPEYECYRAATCSVNKNDSCGWVMDDDLKQCLANTFVSKLLKLK